MTKLSTVSFDGTNYQVIQNGGTYTKYNLTVQPGDAVINCAFDSNVVVTLASQAFSEHNLYVGPLSNLEVGPNAISYADTIGSFPYGAEEDVWGLSTLTTLQEGRLVGEAGGTVMAATIDVSTVFELMSGSKAFFVTDHGDEAVVGIDNNSTISGAGASQNIGNGGITNDVLALNDAVIYGFSGIQNHSTLEVSSSDSLSSGAVLNGALLNGGQIIAEMGSIIKGAITFGSDGGVLTDATAGSIKIKKFGKYDVIDLSVTSVEPSKTITLGTSGILSIGSIRLDFEKGAGMVLALTSTSSGVDISFVEKAGSTDKENFGQTYANVAMSNTGRTGVIPFSAPISLADEVGLSGWLTGKQASISTSALHVTAPAALSSHGIVSCTNVTIKDAIHHGVGDGGKLGLTSKADFTVFDLNGFSTF